MEPRFFNIKKQMNKETKRISFSNLKITWWLQNPANPKVKSFSMVAPKLFCVEGFSKDSNKHITHLIPDVTVAFQTRLIISIYQTWTVGLMADVR